MSRTDEAFVNLVYLTAAEGDVDKLEDLLLEAVGGTLAMPGNQGFSIHRSTANPADFLVVERWADDRAFRGDARSTVLGDVLARTGQQELVASGPTGSRWTRII